jgi:parvulin-like peptidyl-prolyl isomerase
MTANTEDPGVASYPDGYLFQSGEMVAEFEDATAALEIGQVSGIVETTYGYHIIYRIPI